MPELCHTPFAETTIPGAQDHATDHLTRSPIIDKCDNRKETKNKEVRSPFLNVWHRDGGKK